MNRLLTDWRAKSLKRFVGRARELKQMDEWLDDSSAPFRIFAVSGIGGIGKSTLMAEMMRIAKKRNCLGIWLDGRSCTPSPAGFIEYLKVTIDLEILEGNFLHSLEPLLHANPNHRAILCIDNFESLSLLEGWLLQAFIPKLRNPGIVIILSSRSELSLLWKMCPFLGESIIKMPLTYLSSDEIFDYIGSAAPLCLNMEGEIARASEGHPLALALAVESVITNKGRSVPDKMLISQSVSTYFLNELTAPELQHMVEGLMVLQQANLEMLSLILEKPITLAEYHLLQGISFIQSSSEGLVLHDLVRIHLLRDFRLREPKRLNELCTKAAVILNQKLQAAERSKRSKIALQMLSLCKETLPFNRLYADLSIDYFGFSPENMLTEDLPGLHELLRSWCEYSVDAWQAVRYHKFLDDLAASFPESIAVIRNTTDKQPIAMFICVLVYEETSQLLNQYFPAKIKECFKLEELSCPKNAADTYYAVLVAAADGLKNFTREELVGMLTLDRLSLLGKGARVLLVATNPDLKLFLKQLGFNMRPASASDCDTYDAKADIMELDLRNNNFGSWIMSFFKENPDQIKLVPSININEKEVRKLLASLHSSSKLQSFVPLFIGEDSGVMLQKRILSILKSHTSGLSEQDRTILHITYYTHANNRIAAVHACSMSRATFYRHLNKAIANFTEMLIVNCGEN